MSSLHENYVIHNFSPSPSPFIHVITRSALMFKNCASFPTPLLTGLIYDKKKGTCKKMHNWKTVSGLNHNRNIINSPEKKKQHTFSRSFNNLSTTSLASSPIQNLTCTKHNCHISSSVHCLLCEITKNEHSYNFLHQ